MNNYIEAFPGETIFAFLLRAIEEAKRKKMYLKATHNDVSIFVAPESYVIDLCDKHRLQKIVDSK